jgi:sugar transferase (PEP-CTERM system associated)
MPRRSRTLSLGAGQTLLALDCLGLLALWPATLLVAAPHLPHFQGAAALIIYPAFALASLYALGLYRRDTGTSLRRALGRVPLAATAGALAASGAMLLFAPDAARLGLAAGACVVTGAAGARIAFDSLRRRGMVCRRLLILGAGHRAWDLVHILAREGRTLGYEITFLHDPALGTIDPRLLDHSAGAIITAGPGGIRDAATRICPDEIVVAPDERRGMDLHGLLDCKIKGFPVSEYLGFLEREVRRVDIKRVELSWLLYSDGFHMGIIDRTLKRALDLTASIAGLILFGPFVLAAAIAVKLEDGGPALYKQTRITLHGREFQILKLRTMRTDAERGGAVWAATGDKRITRLGTFLRRTRLDELPQLINVLRGEMSFVGPRPERPQFVAMLASHLPLYHERHAAKAGLTGWAQINYPYGASIDDARSKLSYDLYYVKNFSILFDLLIILQTVRVVLWPGTTVR